MLSKQLQDQIEQEAKHKGKNHMFIPMDGNYSSYEFHGFIAERSYLSAAQKYAALYETALARLERAEKLIEQLNNQSFIKGVPGATWGDTEYDSMAAAAGYNQAIMNMKTLLVNAFTPKTGEDE